MTRLLFCKVCHAWWNGPLLSLSPLCPQCAKDAETPEGWRLSASDRLFLQAMKIAED